MIFPKKGVGTAPPSGGVTTLGGGTATSGCGTPFRPVPVEFNHC